MKIIIDTSEVRRDSTVMFPPKTLNMQDMSNFVLYIFIIFYIYVILTHHWPSGPSRRAKHRRILFSSLLAGPMTNFSPFSDFSFPTFRLSDFFRPLFGSPDGLLLYNNAQPPAPQPTSSNELRQGPWLCSATFGAVDRDHQCHMHEVVTSRDGGEIADWRSCCMSESAVRGCCLWKRMTFWNRAKRSWASDCSPPAPASTQILGHWPWRLLFSWGVTWKSDCSHFQEAQTSV